MNIYNLPYTEYMASFPGSPAHERKIKMKGDKLFQALYRFSVLQATEIWAGPGTKATEYVFSLFTLLH